MADPDESRHTPVLVAEVVDALRPRPDGIYVDCTYGRGGHARALLERIGPGGRVLALDRDPTAVAAGRELAAREPRLSLVHANFVELAHIAQSKGIRRRVDGILFDLGVSSPQLDDSRRGFSFRDEGALDMRMDTTRGESAAEWLARASLEDIAGVIRTYGEERHAKRIARAIVAARAKRPIRTTRELAEIIVDAGPPGGPRRKHPATRSFQAIRIHINRELEALQAALDQVPEVLAPGGRFAVLSFHSLEDRVVKRFIRTRSRPPAIPKGFPVPQSKAAPVLRPVGRAVRPSAAEVSANPRARSAVLRVAERTS